MHWLPPQEAWQASSLTMLLRSIGWTRRREGRQRRVSLLLLAAQCCCPNRGCCCLLPSCGAVRALWKPVVFNHRHAPMKQPQGQATLGIVACTEAAVHAAYAALLQAAAGAAWRET